MHSFSAPASPDTSETRVGETAAKLKTALAQSNTHLFRDVPRTSQVSYAHHGNLKHANMPSHATNMPRFMPMFIQVKTTNLKKTDREHTRRKHIFTFSSKTYWPLQRTSLGVQLQHFISNVNSFPAADITQLFCKAFLLILFYVLALRFRFSKTRQPIKRSKLKTSANI